MSTTSLVIMAAGMGSRFGGIKQLEPVGPSGEIIMDYSIYDAIEAGFNKIVFIIRKDLEKDFKEVIGNRIEKLIQVEYVFQELEDLPSGFKKPEGRTKPWGTGQAILCCKDLVKEPFAVINADDYYGKEALQKIYQFLNTPSDQENQYCMAGFILGNTLSDNGTVTRGICKGEDGVLKSIVETSGIKKEGDHAAAKDPDGNDIILDLNSLVSMNMWGFKPVLFAELEKGFIEFQAGLTEVNQNKKEYLLPEVVGDLITNQLAEVTILKTADRWFGVTYREDKETVVKSFQDLVDQGVYPSKLFA
ncbi:MAG: nucleotidyltransferase [Lachnospiraceae bacterium]|nr:nucleotidyltransferase [Lachnospiraceae bacterium]